MKHPFLLFAGCLLGAGLFVKSILAADPSDRPKPAAITTASPNAAIIYWQAFALMPKLSDEQKQKLEAATKAATIPVSDDLRSILALFDPTLRELQRVRTVQHCDWQMNYDAGPHLLMPHLQRARELSAPALLRARVRFATGETTAAVSDVMTVLKMARDCGVSPLLIPLLVDVAMEKNAFEVLSAYLPSLAPQQLDELALALKQLPPTASFADCIRGEAGANGVWIEHLVEAEAAKINDPKAGSKIIMAFEDQIATEGDLKPDADFAEVKRVKEMYRSMTVAEVRESVRLMQADYSEMAKIASLDWTEQLNRWAEYESQLAAATRLTKRDDVTRYFSTLFLPQGSKAFDRDEQLYVRRHLIELAVQIQRHGPEAIKSAKPIGRHEVKYQKTDSGFELHCPLATPEKVLTVSVGSKK